MEKGKILIVEDEVIVARDIQGYLLREGYEVPMPCTSGPEALNAAGKIRPDLVLMDIQLKGEMDGVETAERIYTQLEIPIIYVTAFQDSKTLERAKLSAPFGYLLKPFGERELLTTIEIALYKHQMEKRLKEREEWLSALLGSIGEGVIALDPDQKVLLLNPIGEKLTGHLQTDSLGKNLDEIFRAVPKEGESGRRFDLITPDGQKSVIEMDSFPIKSLAGHESGRVVVFRDTSEQDHLDREIQKFQRLESLGLLAGGIAHDFNNILTSILGNLSLARLTADPQSELGTMLDESEKACWRARDLTQQLLTFSKGGMPLKKAENIQELIQNVAGFSLRGSKVELETEFDEDLSLIYADAGQINQVIQNLTINAREAMPLGGKIRFEGRNVRIQKPQDAWPEVAPFELAPGNYVKLKVSDSGIGIDPELLSKIFDPYFTTKQQGSGLGLAIVYSVVKKHGGAVGVTSTRGEGTTFILYLPANHTQTVSAAAPEKKAVRTTDERILILDDEPGVLKLELKMLQSLGYQPTGTESTETGKELFSSSYTQGNPYSAVLLDMRMGGNNEAGLELCRYFKSVDPKVRLVLASGHVSDTDRARFQEAGFSGMLQKPFGLDQLADEFRKALSAGN